MQVKFYQSLDTTKWIWIMLIVAKQWFTKHWTNASHTKEIEKTKAIIKKSWLHSLLLNYTTHSFEPSSRIELNANKTKVKGKMDCGKPIATLTIYNPLSSSYGVQPIARRKPLQWFVAFCKGFDRTPWSGLWLTSSTLDDYFAFRSPTWLIVWLVCMIAFHV